MGNKVKGITLGCRFNFYESEVAKAIINKLDPSDKVVIINTCSVTSEAERQSRQVVRKAIRENKNAKIIVTGCAAKTSEDYFKKLDGVFKVIQNEDKENLEAYSNIPYSSAAATFDDDLIDEKDQLFENRARAFVQIQNGCDNFCSYCIVPFTRGRPRSLPLKNILRKIEIFSEKGFKEIVLSGIDITSYGKELDFKTTLSDVIESILKEYPNQNRIRISSIDPNGVSERLFELFAHEKRIMPHFHLSVQSGDNQVLKDMKRRHTREDVISLCNRLKAIREEIVFGCDLIPGFPTETENMFKNTVNFIDEAELALLHVFPFSPRKGTIAAQMIQLPRAVILERGRLLREKACDAKFKLLESAKGKIVRGIIEKEEAGISYGKTDSFVPFMIKKSYKPLEVVSGLKVVSHDGERLIVS